jgi:hypothetical protein
MDDGSFRTPKAYQRSCSSQGIRVLKGDASGWLLASESAFNIMLDPSCFLTRKTGRKTRTGIAIASAVECYHCIEAGIHG